MTTPARIPGKRGRKPAKRLPLRYIHEYAAAPLPPPNYPVDVTGGIADHAWGMLANGPDPSCTTHPDGLGDCGYAGRQHYRMAKAACYGQAETWETSDELAAEYLAYDNGQDGGVVLADVLLAWYKAGKILAFAPVDHTSPAAVDAAMQAFKGIYAGVNLPPGAEGQFGQGKPWTLAGQQPDPQLGHCIVKVTADGRGADGWVTWGARQDSDTAWTAVCMDEAWVVVTSEDEAARIRMTELLADIDALHGPGGAAPPTPAPPPGPEPAGLLADLTRYIREVAASADRDITHVIAWLRENGL